MLYLLSVLAPFVFFFNDTPSPEIYTFPYTTLFRSLRIEAHPQSGFGELARLGFERCFDLLLDFIEPLADGPALDRKSTRLNSSHTVISYAVFCLKKKIYVFA